MTLKESMGNIAAVINSNISFLFKREGVGIKDVRDGLPRSQKPKRSSRTTQSHQNVRNCIIGRHENVPDKRTTDKRTHIRSLDQEEAQNSPHWDGTNLNAP